MSGRPQTHGGSWPLFEELLERGDPAAVDELRRLHDPDALGRFAAVWYDDRRPAARRLLLLYLDQPLNAPRHEPLVKRLFKLAETAGDDEIMGRFLVLFDRSVRRQRRKRSRWDRDARQAVAFEVAASPSNSVMPRGDAQWWDRLTDKQREAYASRTLFSVPTRNYLRRRAWRYFRRLGRKQPARYLAAVRDLLMRYRDADAADGLALLDNWGLVHILFHFSPALASRPAGWKLAEGSSLAQVSAAPIYLKLWKADPAPLLELLDAPARPVRQWAIQMLKREHPAALPAVPLDRLIAWLGHPSAEMVALAVEYLKTGDRLAGVEPERLLHLLTHAAPETLEMLCGLAASALRPEQLTVAQAVGLARQRPAVLAQLGFDLLRRKPIQTREEAEALLQLGDAEADGLRVEMVRWTCGVLGASPYFSSSWVLEYLDSRHEAVRSEGWAWLEAESRAHQDVEVWRRLLESPYDNVRLRMLERLEAQTAGRAVPPEGEALDPARVRLLWATVLLNVARGSRSKPAVVRQLVNRLDRRPGEAAVLLPILSVALRSLRGPEFRAGLVGVVNAVRRRPEIGDEARRLFPELRMAAGDGWQELLGVGGMTKGA